MDKEKVLLVDDNPTNLQVLFQTLEGRGYNLLVAKNGETALAITGKAHPNLILLDIMMPGMDGYEVCRKIKKDCGMQHIPVIFITAKTEAEDVVKGFDAGGSDYVAKPFRAPELLARVKKEVELKILRGLIPICSNCKDIRDDEGVWNKIEAYIQKHSAALFSHSICPKCIKKLYGDEDWNLNR
ncbi:MAG: response regulator [Deltaproteobacteria bacterium]|nr:response regulator [Deltaproteobacteria bacterium]